MQKPQSLRSLQLAHILFGVSFFAVLVRLGMFVVYAPFVEGDTELLVRVHTNAIRACLKEGHLVNCPDSGVWPLFQNLSSLLLSYFGFSTSSILHALSYLSFLSFLSSVLLIFWTLKRKASVAPAITGILIIITSPLLWYSHSTFGEMAAAFLILAFTATCLMRAPSWVVVSLLFLAGSTKEVAVPFLVVIGLLCVFAGAPATERRKRVAALIGAATITIAATAAFNYFRYGTFLNSSYASKLYIVPTFKLQVSFFLGIWLSPNGGLAVFWPSFMLLYLAVAGAVLLQIARNKFSEGLIGLERRSFGFYVPLMAISAILFLLTAGFSRWFTPLGGFAWGPRYMLPWIPALSLLLIYFYREELGGILGLILHQRIGLALSALVIFVVSVPQFSILFGDFVLAKIFSYPDCPRVPVIQEGAAYYFQCLQTQIWPRHIFILELYRIALKPPALWFSILCGAVLVTGLLSMRKQLVTNEISRKASSSIAASLSATAAMLRRAIETPLRHSLFVIAFYALVFVAFFFPAIYQGHLLAVGGDGLYLYLPNFYSHKVLWDTLLFSGFPMMADPQVMTWYPPAFLLSLLPGSWNVFMILAYIAGSSLMYGYVHTLTRSRLAALTSGLIFGLSGFMMAHLGHAVIIHAAAWIPLILWALERLRQQLTVKWLVIGSVAVTLSFLGGHSQIYFYGLILSAAYAIVLGWSAPIGRWRYYAAALLMSILGISLAAIQIIPTVELLGQSARVGYSFQDFVSHSLPPRQALTMIFPAVFGAVRESGAMTYFGAPNQTELTGYVGLLPLMLVAVGLIATKKKSLGLFWLCLASLAFLLAMGDATPLARLVYHVPILNGFRAPARHFIELTVAVSVLSGLGVAAILRREVSARFIRGVVVVAGLVMIVCVLLLFMNSSYMAALAAHQDAIEYDQLLRRPWTTSLWSFAAYQDINKLNLLPWKNHAVGVPIVIFVLATAVLVYWHRKPDSLARQALLLSVLIIDLGSFGWFYEWRYVSPGKNLLTATEIANRYNSFLDAAHQRLMTYRGAFGSTGEIPPNLSRLWGVPSANGYNVLIFSRTSNLLSMNNIGVLESPVWRDPDNKGLDLMAVRYFFLPHYQSSKDERGVSWLKDDMQFWLGAGCTQPPRKHATVALTDPVKSTALSIVSRLACASQIPDGTEVARVKFVDADGNAEERSLVAGRDASEWAYDCDRVKPYMKHQRATIFKSYPAKFDEPCDGHFYVSTLPLHGVKDIRNIEFEWLGGPGSIILEKLSLIDQTDHSSYPIDPALLDHDAWRLVEDTGEARVYENLHVMPRAWLATEVVSITPDQALNAIKTGTLPDGRSFDPNRSALVEAPLTLTPRNVSSGGTASVVASSDDWMEVRTSSTAPTFLVTSDAYYPGWRAKIDGLETGLYRADYAIRGVMLPPGEHIVRFDYRPRSFYFGAGVSILSLLVLGAIASAGFFYRKSKHQTHSVSEDFDT